MHGSAAGRADGTVRLREQSLRCALCVLQGAKPAEKRGRRVKRRRYDVYKIAAKWWSMDENFDTLRLRDEIFYPVIMSAAYSYDALNPAQFEPVSLINGLHE